MPKMKKFKGQLDRQTQWIEQGAGEGRNRRNRGLCCAKKVSISLPEDLIEFLDSKGHNRSKIIVTILEEYKNKKQNEDLSKAYEEYSEFCREDGSEFEETQIKDLEGEE